MSEHELQREIIKALSVFGICYRLNVGDFRSVDGKRYIPSTIPRGFSDLIFVRNGRISFVEVKVKPNKPSVEQEAFIKLMRKHGCAAGVAYSVDDALEICALSKYVRK